MYSVGMLADLATVSPGMGPIGRTPDARPGPWHLAVIDSADITDDRLPAEYSGLRAVDVVQNAWTERQLLRPFDLLITARSRRVKVAIVPADVTRTVAASTLLVVRVADASAGLAHYLWYFLTSQQGRMLVESQITQGVTIPTLSARALGSIEVPVPGATTLRAFPRFVEALTTAHDAAVDAARVRRDILREAIVGSVAATARRRRDARRS